MPIDNIKNINGIQVDVISKIIDNIDWEHIMKTALPSYFHGDLQPENIIIGRDNQITLIDWRESFGDDIDIGDFYYDLGKLYHGLLINGKMSHGYSEIINISFPEFYQTIKEILK